MQDFYSFLLLFGLLVLIICCEPLGPSYEGKVVKVKDGDSIVLLEDKKQVEIRMAHIDAPEYNQPYGRKAKEHLANLLAGADVTYKIYEDRDRYGRIVAVVYVNDSINVNKAMVEAGYAWHFKKYSNNFTYGTLERKARLNKAGLWVEPDPIAPWVYRK